jgi:hypothetical protein
MGEGRKKDKKEKTFQYEGTRYSWLISVGFTMKTALKCKDRVLGCKSSQRPSEPTFQPKTLGSWNKSKPYHVFKIREKA